MPRVTHATVKNGDVVVLVGTMKGAFLARSRPSRARWDVVGPLFPGASVYAMAYDGRAGRKRLWAGPWSMHWGAVLSSSRFDRHRLGDCRGPSPCARGAPRTDVIR